MVRKGGNKTPKSKMLPVAVGWVSFFNPTLAEFSLGYAIANPTYAKSNILEVLSVNQVKFSASS